MCGAAQGPDELIEDAAAFGINLPDELWSPEECVVLRENWDAVRAFLASTGQWRMVPNGHRTGLDYAAAKAAAQGLGIRWRKVFEAVAVMEAEALRIWATSRG